QTSSQSAFLFGKRFGRYVGKPKIRFRARVVSLAVGWRGQILGIGRVDQSLGRWQARFPGGAFVPDSGGHGRGFGQAGLLRTACGMRVVDGGWLRSEGRFWSRNGSRR